jgi:hypothetical protein
MCSFFELLFFLLFFVLRVWFLGPLVPCGFPPKGGINSGIRISSSWRLIGESHVEEF